jgi:EmrB/QacA subfamily drug resistance transporter
LAMKPVGSEPPVSTLSESNPINGSNRKWWILSVSAMGVFLSTLDASIVNIALPTISDHFNTSVQLTAWVTISYLLVITALLLIFGRLSDLYGQKLIFTGGLLLFTLGSGLCAISTSIIQLVLYRSLQGVGAAMIVSNTSAIVTNAFPPEQRGTALGTIGAIVSIGLMSGPPLGGFLIHFLGWHSIFLVNVPIGIIAILLTLKILPEHKAAKGARMFHPLDSLLWVAAVLALVMAFRASGEMSSIIRDILIYTIICLGLIVVFIIRQKKAESPLLNPQFLKNSIFVYASVAGFFSYMAMIALTFMLPYLLEHTFGKSPLDTGTILVVIPATTVFASPISGILSDKFGQRPIASIGALISTLAIISMFLVSPDVPIWHLIISLVAFGVGLGMFGSPNNSALMGSVDYKDRGSAGGVLATVRNLGMVTGLGIISIIYNIGIKNSPRISDVTTYAHAFSSALPVVIAFSFVALIFSALRKSVAKVDKSDSTKVDAA